MLSFPCCIKGKFINKEWKQHGATHITLFYTTIAFNQIWKSISTSHTRQDCVLHNLWLHRTLFPRYFFCDIRHNRCLETESNAFSKSIKATYSFLLSTNDFCTLPVQWRYGQLWSNLFWTLPDVLLQCHLYQSMFVIYHLWWHYTIY